MIVPPPYDVQQRAWECALVLRENFELPIEGAIRAEVVLRIGPERLGWDEVRDMLQLYSATARVRV
jgi:hypothetical protein